MPKVERKQDSGIVETLQSLVVAFVIAMVLIAQTDSNRMFLTQSSIADRYLFFNDDINTCNLIFIIDITPN